jgi:hypothetical protein
LQFRHFRNCKSSQHSELTHSRSLIFERSSPLSFAFAV